MRMGMYPEAPPLPFVPGYEVAGTVLEVGAQVTLFKPGDRVVGGSKFGGYVSEIVLPEFQVRKTPSHLSDAEAASIPVNFMTAWTALEEMGRVRKGDRVLIPSAAGGVGVAAVQIAAQRGAHVVGLVGSPSKIAVVRELGAAETMTNEEWEKASDKDAGGFDIVLDATGGESVKRSMRRLGHGGPRRRLRRLELRRRRKAQSGSHHRRLPAHPVLHALQTHGLLHRHLRHQYAEAL